MKFKQAFFNCYNKAHLKGGDFTYARRSHYMLWEESSVIKETAKQLGFSVASGEPLRLDAVLVKRIEAQTWRRLPVRAAIEHENNAWTLDQELRLLLAVRAPLKVAITYFQSNDLVKNLKLKQWLKEKLVEEYELALENIGESPNTEYLILIGEDDGQGVPFSWEYLTFDAEEGPFRAVFTRE